jgi:hypothetical protein
LFIAVLSSDHEAFGAKSNRCPTPVVPQRTVVP